MRSHPVWVRGLKLVLVVEQFPTGRSHPVWVRGLKLTIIANFVSKLLSHPVWVRGLKHCCFDVATDMKRSHPVWVRGLKLVFRVGIVRTLYVAPRVGAWIETIQTQKKEHE